MTEIHLKNLDKEIMQAVEERTKEIASSINQVVTEERLVFLIGNFIKDKVDKAIIEKIKNLVQSNTDDLIKNIIEDLFSQEEFRDQLKERAVKHLVHDIRYDY